MGQKVNPVGLRIGINRDWSSRWYANKKDFSQNLVQDMKIRNYLEPKLKDALLSTLISKESRARVAKLLSLSLFTSLVQVSSSDKAVTTLKS